MTGFTDDYDAEGRWIACTWGSDPARSESWRNEYDAEGRRIARTWGSDPARPESWRKSSE